MIFRRTALRKYRRFFTAFTSAAMALLLPLPASASGSPPAEAVFSLDASELADRWQLCHDEASGVEYWMLDAVYCSRPVLASAQHLTIYAPEAYMTRQADGSVVVKPDGAVISSTGIPYTAMTAPILLYNTSGGYSSSAVTAADLSYLQEGYVHVAIATRGKETQNEAGEYIGQFPALIVDMKAGVRYLKANDAVLPGSARRIVSRGFSSGGAVSAMLGASGNSPLFEPYLKAIGAADSSDDIWMALCSAPITNLSSADAAYEWYQKANTSYWLFNAMAFDREGNDIRGVFPTGPNHIYPLGSNVLGGAHEDELSAKLYARYVDYVRSLGFDLGENGRSGAFYEDFTQLYADALAEYIARYDELKTDRQPETVEEYLVSLGEGWFTYDAVNGNITINSLDDVITHHIARKKMCPSLDSYNYRSNENSAFVQADGTTVHFSPVVRDGLNELLREARDGLHPDWSQEDIHYLTLLVGDYAAVTDEAAAMLEVMSPINYILGERDYAERTIAPFWRLRVGSEDGDHGAPAAWLIAQGLEKHTDADVSVGIAWGMGHSLSELTEQDLYDYIAAAFAK